MRLAFVLATVAYVAALASWHAGDAGRAGVIDVLLQAREAGLSARAIASAMLQWLAMPLLLAPIAILAVGAIRGAPRGLRGWATVWLPAFAVALSSAALMRARVGDGWSLPPLADLVLPAIGAACGASIGCALAMGLAGVRRLLMKVAVGSALVLAVSAGTAGLALSTQPLDVPVTSTSSTEKRAVFGRLRGHNPLTLPPGATRTLVLDHRSLDVLLKQTLLLMADDVRTQVAAGADGALRFAAGIGVASFFLNARGELAASIRGGRLETRRCQLAVGGLMLPERLCGAGLRAALSMLFADRASNAASRSLATRASLHTLHLDAGGLNARYGKVVLDEEVESTLRDLLGPGQRVREAVLAQYAALIPRLRREHGDAAFTNAVHAAFALARQRARDGAAAAENQAAVLALGILIGHRSVARVAVVDDPPANWAGTRTITLRGRNDWARHFVISAALTQIATARLSDAAGLFKEELDAGGGSGFSFADLLADRAGTRFGETATADDDTARRLQALLATATGDDLLPVANDLPEGLQEAALQDRFGGVGGAGYAQMMAEIEARLGRYAVYQLGEHTGRSGPPT